MPTLRRLLLAALLTGLVMGCQKKSQPVGVEETPAEHMARKIKQMKEAPEGPQLRPDARQPGRIPPAPGTAGP
jgi:hypothetical protein